jgi:hypothetical protein
VQIEHLPDRVYHYCRCCRSKLPTPVSNSHQAFCTPGCHVSFYLRRCLVCEGYRGKFTRKLCHKPACRSEYRRNRALFDFDRSSKGGGRGLRQTDFRSAHFTGLKSGWFVVAGPGFGPSALHCATVGAEEAVATTNRLRHWRENCLIQPYHPPVNILGGYKFPQRTNDRSGSRPACRDCARWRVRGFKSVPQPNPRRSLDPNLFEKGHVHEHRYQVVPLRWKREASNPTASKSTLFAKASGRASRRLSPKTSSRSPELRHWHFRGRVNLNVSGARLHVKRRSFGATVSITTPY